MCVPESARSVARGDLCHRVGSSYPLKSLPGCATPSHTRSRRPPSLMLHTAMGELPPLPRPLTSIFAPGASSSGLPSMVLPGGPGGGSVFGSLSQMNSAVVPPFPAHLRPSSAPASERDVSPGRSLHQQQLSRSGIPSLEGRAASEVANSRDQGSANRSRAASPSRLSEESQGVHGQQPLWVPALPHKIKACC